MLGFCSRGALQWSYTKLCRLCINNQHFRGYGIHPPTQDRRKPLHDRHTAYTASSHEATKNNFSRRRALIGGTAALEGCRSAQRLRQTAAQALIKDQGAGAGANIEDLYNINAQDVNSLKKGGNLRLPAGSIGPNFNFYTQSGNTSDNVNVMSTISQTGMWNLDFDGTYKLNTDFAVSFGHSKKGDKVQVAVKLNLRAVFNIGTPITTRRSSPPGTSSEPG